jgi:hypothetical protein
MNKGKLLRGIGVAIALFGVLMMVYAVLPADDSYEQTLPSGDYYYYFGYGNLISGSIDVTFAASEGRVVVFVFASDQYEVYALTGSADYLFQASGGSGMFTFDLPDMGTYYFVFQHSDTSQFIQQDLQISATVNGVAVFGLAVGVVMIAVGGALAFFGARIMKNEQKMAPVPSAPSDVVIFQGEQRKPPTQP